MDARAKMFDQWCEDAKAAAMSAATEQPKPKPMPPGTMRQVGKGWVGIIVGILFAKAGLHLVPHSHWSNTEQIGLAAATFVLGFVLGRRYAAPLLIVAAFALLVDVIRKYFAG